MPALSAFSGASNSFSAPLDYAMCSLPERKPGWISVGSFTIADELKGTLISNE
jgi:hypothetical protein